MGGEDAEIFGPRSDCNLLWPRRFKKMKRKGGKKRTMGKKEMIEITKR
jgi:hypothetical protein